MPDDDQAEIVIRSSRALPEAVANEVADITFELTRLGYRVEHVSQTGQQTVSKEGRVAVEIVRAADAAALCGALVATITRVWKRSRRGSRYLVTIHGPDGEPLGRLYRLQTRG